MGLFDLQCILVHDGYCREARDIFMYIFELLRTQFKQVLLLQMIGDANGSGDDVTFSGSFGWLFSTVTAFVLLVFLLVSFVCYHRRLATRKAREDEYAEFVRTYRPDLDSKGLKKPRAT